RHPDEVVMDRPGQVVDLEQVNLRQQLVVDQSFERLSFQPAAAAAPMLQQVVVRDHRTPDVVVRDHRTMGPDGPGPIVRDHRHPLPEPFPRPLPRPLPKPPEPIPDPNGGPSHEPEPEYLLVSTTQDVSVPLRFDVDAHPYLFPSGQPQASKGFASLVVP